MESEELKSLLARERSTWRPSFGSRMGRMVSNWRDAVRRVSHELYEDASDESIADEKTVWYAKDEDLLAAFNAMMATLNLNLP